MTLYHVTSADSVHAIWRQGLTSCPPKSDWVEDRRAMHQYLDELGQQTRSAWEAREGAVYFWPTYDAARIYSGRHLHPAIVEVDTANITPWMVPNEPVERLFDEYVSTDTPREADIVQNLAEQVVRTARPWAGQRDDDVEVWVQPPVPAPALTQIVDHRGEPFDIE